MGNVTVLFFGATADAVGLRQHEMEIAGDETVGSLASHLIEENPRLREKKLLFAVNEEYADPERLLAAGDNVAVFSPVSGG